MKTLLLMMTLFASTSGSLCLASDKSERPIGIDAANWIFLNDKLGFVVVSTAEGSIIDGTSKPLSPTREGQHQLMLLNKVVPAAPATGYFMVRTAEGWRRLVVMGPGDIAAVKKG